MDTLKEFAKFMVHSRRRLLLKGVQVARELNITPAMLWRYENQFSMPTKPTFDRICKLYQISPEKLRSALPRDPRLPRHMRLGNSTVGRYISYWVAERFKKILRQWEQEKYPQGGITPMEISMQMGRQPTYYLSLRRGHRKMPPFKRLRQVAKFFGKGPRRLYLLRLIDTCPESIRKEVRRKLWKEIS